MRKRFSGFPPHDTANQSPLRTIPTRRRTTGRHRYTGLSPSRAHLQVRLPMCSEGALLFQRQLSPKKVTEILSTKPKTKHNILCYNVVINTTSCVALERVRTRPNVHVRPGSISGIPKEGIFLIAKKAIAPFWRAFFTRPFINKILLGYEPVRNKHTTKNRQRR